MKRAVLQVPLALLALLLVLELLLRVLPVSTATLVADHLRAGIPTVPPRHRWTTATGWDLRNPQTLQANGHGFSARHDFVTGSRAVALIGDSFVEASMLDRDQRLDALLEASLNGRAVYAMGSPGSSLLDYGHRLQWAVRAFGLRDAVVFMEHSDATQARCGSGNTKSLCWNRRTAQVDAVVEPSAGLLKRALRHSALMQYLVSQLRLDSRSLLAGALRQLQPAHGHATTPQAAAEAQLPSQQPLGSDERAEIDAVASHFFTQAQVLPGRLVLAVDADRAALKQGDTGSNAAREHFMDLARARGIEVVDLAPIFAGHLRRSPRTLEVGPYDAHLNPMGLSLVAQAVAQALASASATDSRRH